MLRTFYQVTDKELYHIIPQIEEDIYTLSLFFEDEYYYNECIKRLTGKLSFQAIGYVVLQLKGVYQILIKGLTVGDQNDLHGFRTYIYDSKYILVYWNNKQKQIVFWE